jgi:hypothetical protein
VDLLVQGLGDDPAHPDVESKGKLISRIRHLHLEAPDPYGQAPGPIVDESATPDQRADAFTIVMRTTESGLERLAEHYAHTATPYDGLTPTRLESITFCAFRSDVHWQFVESRWGKCDVDFVIEVRSVRRAASNLLYASGAQHFCQRADYGPFRLNPLDAYHTSYQPSPLGPPATIIHRLSSIVEHSDQHGSWNGCRRGYGVPVVHSRISACSLCS